MVPIGEALAVKENLSLESAVVTLRSLDARDKATKVKPFLTSGTSVSMCNTASGELPAKQQQTLLHAASLHGTRSFVCPHGTKQRHMGDTMQYLVVFKLTNFKLTTYSVQ